MFAFPGMLTDAAQEAGIETPENVDSDDFDKEKYPHWHVFCALQLGQPMPYAGVHYDNAKVIGGISLDEIKTMTVDDFIAKGFNIGFS